MYNDNGRHEVISGFPVFDPTAFVDKPNLTDLEKIFNSQRLLMSACGIDSMEAWRAFYVTVFALIGEAVEAGHNFQDLTKPWKKNVEVDIEDLKEEVIDQFFFVVQESILLGMTAEEFVESYFKKSIKNFERIVEKLRKEGLVE